MSIQHSRELNDHELESISGGAVLKTTFAALNPQPIPPGYSQAGFAGSQATFIGIRLPGCPGPIVLPPSPC